MSRWILCLVAISFAAPTVWGVDYKVEKLAEAAPAGEVAAAILAELSSTGVRVSRGASTTLCDVWLVKEIAVQSGFKPTSELLYPFQPGQLVGVVRFARKGADFRDQKIATGTYTLRYSQQPVDGAHVGTSPTRDFFLLLSAAQDSSPAVLEYKPLTKQSSEAAGSSHPALWSLQRLEAAPAEFPSIRHNEERDWWIVALEANIKADGGTKPLALELVIVGVASE